MPTLRVKRIMRMMMLMISATVVKIAGAKTDNLHKAGLTRHYCESCTRIRALCNAILAHSTHEITEAERGLVTFPRNTQLKSSTAGPRLWVLALDPGFPVLH